MSEAECAGSRFVPAANLGVIIPTWKASGHWKDLSESLAKQGIAKKQVLIIDSSSPDNTCELVRASGYKLVCIPQNEFGHGRTRQAALEYFPEAEYLLYMTQDAILDSPSSVQRLCDTMRDPKVGAAYGRQIARQRADAIERHARLFNYPEHSQQRTFQDRHTMGIRAAFLSNSFAIYRRVALEAVGGFPTDVIFGEDFYVAARLLMNGWTVNYESRAAVVHSHRLSLRQEFTRYYDIGVHHSREPWLLETFGKATGEGIRFVRSELEYLRDNDPLLIPLGLLRTLLKFLAYRSGRLWKYVPASLNHRLSGNSQFWLTH